MAQSEHDAEDLLRDATALTERAEIRLPGAADLVIVGFRRDGCASFFFGLDEVYHFNSRACLRRAAIDGKLLKADREQLASLTRQRETGQVVLLRHELTPAETQSLKQRLSAKLAQLAEALDANRYELLRQAPAETKIVARVRDWIAALPEEIPIAQSPHAR